MKQQIRVGDENQSRRGAVAPHSGATAWLLSPFSILFKSTIPEPKDNPRELKTDKSLISPVLIISIIGLITSYSVRPLGTSIGVAQFEAIIAVVLGLTLGFFSDLKFLKKLSPILLILSTIFCFAVFIPGIGVQTLGASRWIDLKLTQIQPSEIAKIALTIFGASMITYLSSLSRSGELKSFKLVYILGVIFAPLFLVILILQKDLGTTLVLALSLLFMMIVGKIKYRQVMILAVAGILLLIAAMVSSPYRRARLETFLSGNSANVTEDKANSSSYHIRQSLIGIGSGGITGRGLDRGVQGYGYVPVARTDSIFVVYAEKFGFIGSLILLCLYYLVIRKLIQIIKQIEDQYYKTFIAGVLGWIVGNLFVNLYSSLGVIPYTGVPLPLFSVGGSSIISLMFVIGIVLRLTKKRIRKTIVNQYV